MNLRSMLTFLCLTAACQQLGAQDDAQVLEKLQRLPTLTREHTHRARLILTALVQKIEAHAVKHIDKSQKAAIRAWALGMQQYLQDIQNLPHDLAQNIVLKNGVHEHCFTLLDEAIANKFHELPDLNPDPVVKRYFAESLDWNKILALYESNEAKLLALEQKVRNLGLHLGHKFARALESGIKRFKIIPLAGAALFFGAAGFICKKLRERTMVRIDHGTESFPLELSNFSLHVPKVTDAALGTAATLLAQTMVSNSKESLEQYWGETKKYLSRGWNFFKGTESALDIHDYKLVDNSLTLQSEELIGLEEQVEQIKPLLECVTDLEGFVSRGQKPQYGILLVGPSGCGKTHFAGAIAGSMNQIFQASGQSTQVRFKEVTYFEIKARGLRAIIAEARKQGGVVVLFIDEIHNLNMQTHKGEVFTLNEFLTQMSDLYHSDDPNSHVFLIAATNQPKLLDTALRVPGRFGTIIHFKYPDAQKRRALFQTFLPRAGVNPQEIDIESLVRQTDHKVSYSKLRSVINEARIRAAGNNEVVGQAHLQAAVDNIIHRFANTTPATAFEKQIVASHLAGQVLMNILSQSKTHIERITIGGVLKEITEMNEYNTLTNKEDPNKSDLYEPEFGLIKGYNEYQLIAGETPQELEKQCKFLLAGVVAQDIMLGTHSNTYRAHDQHEAYGCALKIVLDGRRLSDLSEQRQNDAKNKAQDVMTRYKTEVTALLQTYKAKLGQLMKLLEEQVTISGTQAQAIINQP